MSKNTSLKQRKKVADETTWRNSIMESIARCLSLPLPIKRCRKCKEYKRTMANLVQIIQEQNQQLQNLQRQLDFTKAQYLEQNQRLSRTQEKFLCHTCLVNFKKPNTNCELCPQCSQILPKWSPHDSSRRRNGELDEPIQPKQVELPMASNGLGGSGTLAGIINHVKGATSLGSRTRPACNQGSRLY